MEEFAGCWWRCEVKAPKAGAAGAGGAGDGSGGPEGIQRRSPKPDDSARSEPLFDWRSCSGGRQDADAEGLCCPSLQLYSDSGPSQPGTP